MISVNYYALLPIVPIFAIFFQTRKAFTKTSREIYRMEATSKRFYNFISMSKIRKKIQGRSPIFSHATSTAAGIVTIRACRNENTMLEEFKIYSDENTKPYFINCAISRWFAMRLDNYLLLFILVAIFSCIGFKSTDLLKYSIIVIK
jgi:hypothetical protein